MTKSSANSPAHQLQEKKQQFARDLHILQKNLNAVLSDMQNTIDETELFSMKQSTNSSDQ